jgi:hypothetical protein
MISENPVPRDMNRQSNLILLGLYEFGGPSGAGECEQKKVRLPMDGPATQ